MSDSIVDGSPRKIGTHEVGPLACGLWRFVNTDLAACTAVIEAALSAGMNLIDNADVYGFDWGGTGFGLAEENLGKVLAAQPTLRDQMVIATKGGIMPPLPYDSSPEYLRKAVDGSLARMGIDHIDVYQIHRPDMFAHPESVAGVLDELVASGKVGAVGVSNYTVPQTAALNSFLENKLVSIQPEFSASHLDPMRDGSFDLAMQHGMTPLAWSPLGGSKLATGEGVSPELLAVIDRLAEREGATRADVAIAFVLAHPSRPVAILGTQNLDRIAAAPAALKVSLDRNDVYDIVAASEGAPLP